MGVTIKACQQEVRGWKTFKMRFRNFFTILICFMMIVHPAASCLARLWTLGTSVVTSLTTTNENNNNNNNNNGGDGGGGESGGEGGNNNNNNRRLKTSREAAVTEQQH